MLIGAIQLLLLLDSLFQVLLNGLLHCIDGFIDHFALLLLQQLGSGYLNLRSWGLSFILFDVVDILLFE